MGRVLLTEWIAEAKIQTVSGNLAQMTVEVFFQIFARLQMSSASFVNITSPRGRMPFVPLEP